MDNINVPVHVVRTCNILPPPADSNRLLIVKLNTKLEYRGHVYFEPVLPSLILKTLQFLKGCTHHAMTLI